MNTQHDPFDSRLRQLAQELHDAAPAPPEWDDIATPPLATSARRPSTLRPARWLALAAAAGVVVIALAGIVVIRVADDDSRELVATDPEITVDGAVDTTLPDVISPTTIPAVSSPDTTSAGSEISSPSNSTTPPTTSAVDLAPIGVSYLDPPPDLELETIASAEVAFDPNRGGPATSVVALERGGLAVIDLAAREIIFIDPEADDRRVGLDPAIPDVTGLAVGGPEDVLYAVLEGGRQTPLSATEIVAIPTDGPRAGQVVASAPIDLMNYTHSDPTVLGLGATGVLDKRTGETLIGFVDATGEPLQVSLPAPSYPLVERTDNWAAYEAGLNVAPTQGAPPMWRVEVDREPSSTGGLSRNPEPSAVSGGRVLVTTAIGANLPGDYGPPTHPVAAVLQPDGSGSWWSVPDGWSLAAADVYGVLYERTTDTTIEIARPSVLQG